MKDLVKGSVAIITFVVWIGMTIALVVRAVENTLPTYGMWALLFFMFLVVYMDATSKPREK